MPRPDPGDPGGLYDRPEGMPWEDWIGTESWAKHVRLLLQNHVKRLDHEPKYVHDYLKLVGEHRAWKMLNKDDGSLFKTFREFAEYKTPWGLAVKYDKIRPFWEAAIGKREFDLMSAPPAQPSVKRSTNNPDDYDSDHTFDYNKRNQTYGHKESCVERAIAERTPPVARDLYVNNCLGKEEALQLGRSPDLDATRALTHIRVPKDERKRPAVKRAANKIVREALNMRPRSISLAKDPSTAAAKIREVYGDEYAKQLKENL